MVVPPVSSLGMDPCVTTLTQSHQVIPVMCTTFSKGQLVVYLFNGYEHSLLVALLTEGVGLNIAVTDAFPRSSIPSPRSRVTVVLLVTLVLFPLVLFTEPTFSKVGTTGVVAGVFRFSWHYLTNLSAI